MTEEELASEIARTRVLSEYEKMEPTVAIEHVKTIFCTLATENREIKQVKPEKKKCNVS